MSVTKYNTVHFIRTPVILNEDLTCCHMNVEFPSLVQGGRWRCKTPFIGHLSRKTFSFLASDVIS